jgi:hypothetical protein
MARLAWMLPMIPLLAACGGSAAPTSPPDSAPAVSTTVAATVAINSVASVSPAASPPTTASPQATVAAETPFTPLVTPVPSLGCPTGSRVWHPSGRHGSGAGAGGGACPSPLGVEACKGFLKQVLGIADEAPPNSCFGDGANQVTDPIGDQFAQDGAPILAPLSDIKDIDFATSFRITNSQIDEELRQQCGTTTADDVQVLCNKDKSPDADAVPTVTFNHLVGMTEEELLYLLGIYERYDDTTPGRQPPPGFPLYIGNGAHALFTAPVETNGSYDPLVYTDFRTNSGAYSTHIQLVGPDWFAFINYDNPLYVRPYVCQSGVDHPACDTPVAPQTAEGFQSVDEWMKVQLAQ